MLPSWYRDFWHRCNLAAEILVWFDILNLLIFYRKYNPKIIGQHAIIPRRFDELDTLFRDFLVPKGVQRFEGLGRLIFLIDEHHM